MAYYILFYAFLYEISDSYFATYTKADRLVSSTVEHMHTQIRIYTHTGGLARMLTQTNTHTHTHTDMPKKHKSALAVLKLFEIEMMGV